MANFKPQIGARLRRSQPLARGLIGAWLMNEGAGEKVFDLSYQARSGTISSGVSWVPEGLRFDGTSNATVDLNKLYSFGATKYTIIAAGSFTTTDINLLSNSGAVANAIFLRGSTGFVYVIDNAYATVSWGVGVDGVHAFAFVSDGSNLELFKDGKSRGSRGFGNVWSVDTIGEDGGIRNADPDLYYLYIYNRDLSAAEIASLHRNPYQMFAPETPAWAFYTPAAGGGLSIPVAMHHYTKTLGA